VRGLSSCLTQNRRQTDSLIPLSSAKIRNADDHTAYDERLAVDWAIGDDTNTGDSRTIEPGLRADQSDQPHKSEPISPQIIANVLSLGLNICFSDT